MQPARSGKGSPQDSGNEPDHVWALDAPLPTLGRGAGRPALLLVTLKSLPAGSCCNTLVNGLEQGGRGVAITFADDTKLGDVGHIRQDGDLMQDVRSSDLQAGNGR